MDDTIAALDDIDYNALAEDINDDLKDAGIDTSNLPGAAGALTAPVMVVLGGAAAGVALQFL
jgi:hypothetical protein